MAIADDFQITANGDIEYYCEWSSESSYSIRELFDHIHESQGNVRAWIVTDKWYYSRKELGTEEPSKWAKLWYRLTGRRVFLGWVRPEVKK